MNKPTENFKAGAENLLLNCAKAKPGDRILLIGEKTSSPYFEPELCTDTSYVAQELGIETEIIMAEPVTDASQFPKAVSDAMMNVDHTVFFSRLGDQVRFVETPGKSKKIMCYTLTREHMSSPFASFDFSTLKNIHDLLKDEITASRHYRFEAGCGTSLSSEIIHNPGSTDAALTEFSLELFPVMIFPPITFQNLCGQLVLKDFLLSSSTRAYDDSVLILKSPVVAIIEDTHVVDFDGDEIEIIKIRKQLERAASITGGNAYRINSWHTGINPYTFYEGDPYANLERWGTVAYGSPRYTHIHGAGKNPGDISIQLFDASISFDGENFWDEGKFVFLDRPEVQALLDDESRKQLNSSTSLSIGI